MHDLTFMDIKKHLPDLVPKAIAWAQEQSDLILRSGASLNENEMALATQVGVAKPGLVRIMYVSKLPMPDDPMLRKVADSTGLNGPKMAGMTLGYGIFILEGRATARLISHELRHVQQYETLGGIGGFMPVYLAQIASEGYDHAPLELDARSHEVRRL